MHAIPLFFAIGFVVSGVLMVRAGRRFHAFAERAGEGTFFRPEHLERPWLWFRDYPQALRQLSRASYQRHEGDAENARLAYVGWRWTMLTFFVGMLITGMIFR